MASKFSVEAIFKAKDQASKIITKLERRFERFARVSANNMRALDAANARVHRSLGQVGARAAIAGAAVGAVVADVVRTGAAFDRQLVTAAAKFDPAIKRGTDGFNRLRAAAEMVGERTEFSAQQGAQALESFAAAGIAVDQAIAVLPATVDLATASNTDLGRATEIATESLGAFALKTNNTVQLTKNLARVSDAMAATANKTAAGMDDMFEAIQEGGPVAVAAGASIETFLAQVGALADAGIKGSSAGTTMKNIYLQLAAPTKQAAGVLRRLGVATKDSNGNLRDSIEIMRDLGAATASMGTADKARALEAIFGKIPIAGVNALLATGADKLVELRTALDGAGGSTAKMAATMRDTVMGDLDELSSRIDSVKIALFSANEGPIRDALQSMTKWVAANKDLIVEKVQRYVAWVRDNLPLIVTRIKQIGTAVAVFYAFAAAVKVARVAIAVYTGVTTAAKWATGLFGKSAATAGAQVEGLAAAGKFGALKDSINGTTSLLGKAGLLGAALAVGYAFGSWLDHEFKISDMLSNWLAKITGVNRELDKAGGRATKRGIDPSNITRVYDGTGLVQLATGEIIDQHGRVVDKTSRAAGAENEIFYNLGTPAAGQGAQVVSPQERVARTITESREMQAAEVTIRDETGRAEVTKKPTGKLINLRVVPSGAL